MAKICFVALAILAVVSATNITLYDAEQFTQGFLLGLEANPKKVGLCYTRIESVISDVTSISSDISRILQGDSLALLQLETDVVGSVSDIKALNGTCNFTGLEASIEQLLSPDGKALIEQRFKSHILTLTKDINTVKDCSANYYKCGEAAGEIVRILTAWQLNAPTPLLGFKKSTPNDFIEGLIKGLERKGEDQCTNAIRSLTSSITGILLNLETLASKSFTVFGALGNNIQSLVDQISAHGSKCKFNVLLDEIKDLDFEALAFRIFFSEKKLAHDVGAIEACSLDYYKCGLSFGDMVKTLTGWSI